MVETITEEDAAPLTALVMWARATVTGLVTGASMTVTPGAGATWSAGATTASSLELTSIPRTTAVRDPMVAEVSLCLVVTILLTEWCRLGAVGGVQLLQQELWCGPVEQTQILQRSGLSSHHPVTAEVLQHSALLRHHCLLHIVITKLDWLFSHLRKV